MEKKKIYKPLPARTRLKRYKLALAYMEENREGYMKVDGWQYGLCEALASDSPGRMTRYASKYYPDSAFDKYPELQKHKPAEGWIDDKRFWWEPEGVESYARRLAAIRDAIAQMGSK